MKGSRSSAIANRKPKIENPLRDITPIHRQYREAKIGAFKEEFSATLEESAARCVAEMIWGIIFSGSIRLSRIARALEESIPEGAVIKRLSRNLARPGLGQAVGKRVLELASQRVRDDSFIIIHRYNLAKRHARDMEFLDDLVDQANLKGYHLCEAIAWDPSTDEVTSLAQTLWSRRAPGFEEDTELSLIRRVQASVENRGIFVGSPPGGSHDLLLQLTRDPSCRYLYQVLPDWPLLYNRKETRVRDLIEACKTPYGDTVYIDYENRESDIFVHYGFLPVRLADSPDQRLWLVVIKGFDERFPGKNATAILTTEPMRLNRSVLWSVVEAYFASLWVESTNTLIKQRCDFEDVRVRSYERLKNIAALVQAASHFSTVVRDFPTIDPVVRFRRRAREDSA